MFGAATNKLGQVYSKASDPRAFGDPPRGLFGAPSAVIPDVPQPNGGERRPWDERPSLAGTPIAPAPEADASTSPMAVKAAQYAALGGTGGQQPAQPERRGFDYNTPEMKALISPEGRKHKIDWLSVLGAAGDALSVYGGGQPVYAQSRQRRDEGAQHSREALARLVGWKHDDFVRGDEANLRASQPFTIGRERLQLDPSTGQVSTLFHGNADSEDYAATTGHEPGTEAYFNAVEDYVLRGNGPSALAYDQQLDDHRTGNRMRLTTQQQAGARSLESQRQHGRLETRSTPSYRDLHPAPPHAARETIPVVSTPAQAASLAPGTRFKTPDGRIKIR